MSTAAACPICGHPSAHDQSQVLLAVCDVLVIKALESMGKWILRVGGRSRFGEAAALGVPLYQAHTRWAIESDLIVAKALRGAWDVIPAMLDHHGCCDISSAIVTTMLDEYVHDLVLTGSPHTLAELHYRFETRLGLPVYQILREASHAPA